MVFSELFGGKKPETQPELLKAILSKLKAIDLTLSLILLALIFGLAS